jgi:hypothetical protein
MTTPGGPETVSDERILNEFMARAASRWGGGRGPCRWIALPSEPKDQAAAAGVRPPEATEAEEAVGGTAEPAEQSEAAPVTEQSEGERPTDEGRGVPAAREAPKPRQAARAKAARAAQPRGTKKAAAPRPARTRGTKNR